MSGSQKPQASSLRGNEPEKVLSFQLPTDWKLETEKDQKVETIVTLPLPVDWIAQRHPAQHNNTASDLDSTRLRCQLEGAASSAAVASPSSFSSSSFAFSATSTRSTLPSSISVLDLKPCRGSKKRTFSEEEKGEKLFRRNHLLKVCISCFDLCLLLLSIIEKDLLRTRTAQSRVSRLYFQENTFSDWCQTPEQVGRLHLSLGCAAM